MKQVLIEIPIGTELETVNGVEHQSDYARYILLERLNNFKGFTGCDYFELGRPLLSKITSNFITYLIILLQFKLSMPVPKDQ